MIIVNNKAKILETANTKTITITFILESAKVHNGLTGILQTPLFPNNYVGGHQTTQNRAQPPKISNEIQATLYRISGKANLCANQCVPPQSSLGKRSHITEASMALQTTIDKSLDKNKPKQIKLAEVKGRHVDLP